MRVTNKRIDDRIDTDSHRRAIDAVDDDRALVEDGELDRYYRVMLPNSSEGAHHSMIAIDQWGHLQASCDCKQVEYRNKLCAHILTLLLCRQEEIETIDGQPITAGDRHDHGQPDDDPEIPIDLTNEVDPDPVTVDDDTVETGEGITVDGGMQTDDNWSDRL
jgi:hypothetical protein